MNGQNSMSDTRRTTRHVPLGKVEVVDTLTDRVVGSLGDLSMEGMSLVAEYALVEDAIYQLEFGCGGGDREPVRVGTHVLWQEQTPEETGVRIGLRFINVPEPCRYRLEQKLSGRSFRR